MAVIKSPAAAGGRPRGARDVLPGGGHGEHSGNALTPQLSAPCSERGVSEMMLVVLAYASRHRWRVFPIGRDCRTPLCAHGCYDASAERYEIDRLFQGRPDANVALACGPASGVFALDVDVKGADGRGEFSPSLKTRTDGSRRPGQAERRAVASTCCSPIRRVARSATGSASGQGWIAGPRAAQ